MILWRKKDKEDHPQKQIALLYQQITQLYGHGQYEDGIDITTQIRKILKKEHGENHPRYATSLNNLALLYKRMNPCNTFCICVEIRATRYHIVIDFTL